MDRALISSDYSYLLDNAGEYVVATDNTVSQPLVTDKGSLTSYDRHVIARSTGTAVITSSTGREVFTRGGIVPLTTPKSSLIVHPLPAGGSVVTTAFLTESGNRLLTESGQYLSYP